MIVVADASPLNYLVQIDCEWVLPDLYSAVLVPKAVVLELQDAGAPINVAAWAAALPGWIDVRSVSPIIDQEMATLDAGEREAILLATEQGADLLLIDERKGRNEAKRRGIHTTGTLGVLLAAGKRHLIVAEDAYRRLIRETTFRTTSKLEDAFLKLAVEDRP